MKFLAANLLIIFLVISLIFINNSNLSKNLFAAVSSDTSYNMGVLVVKYFPLTSNGQNIDVTVTGDVGDPYTNIRQRSINITNNLIANLPKATTYLGYQDPNSLPSLNYQIIDTKEYTQAVPMLTDGSRRPNYNSIMSLHNICDYVENKGVSEVWLWAYQGPNFPGSTQPYLAISESKMSGPFGDISNSYRENNMPICNKTYRVYTFNYGRGTGEAIHSWGHQIESEIDAVNQDFFRARFQGSNYPQTLNITGRCGSVHNPPNARSEYDWANTTPQNSDCLDWNPDSLGNLSQISCQNWGCEDFGDTSNPQLNYIIWNFQNLPGRGNSKIFQGQKIRNMWDIHGDFDNVMRTDKTIFLQTISPSATPIVSPSPSINSSPSPKPSKSPKPVDTTSPSIQITNPQNNAVLKLRSKVNITADASDDVGVSKVEIFINGKLLCRDTKLPYSCNWVVPRSNGISYSISAKAYDKARNTSSKSISIFTK